MKRITLSILAIAITGTLFAAAPKTESFKVDASKSSVTWLAKKVTGQHNGKVVLDNGTLSVANGKISPFLFLTTPDNVWLKTQEDVSKISNNVISGFFMLQYKGKSGKTP